MTSPSPALLLRAREELLTTLASAMSDPTKQSLDVLAISIALRDGRFDHVGATVSTLYERSHSPIVLFTPYDTIMLLPAGRHAVLLEDEAQVRRAPRPPPSACT